MKSLCITWFSLALAALFIDPVDSLGLGVFVAVKALELVNFYLAGRMLERRVAC